MSSPARAGTLVGPRGGSMTPVGRRATKRKLDDNAKEPNKSSQFGTRASTRAAAAEVNHVPNVDMRNSSNREETTTLQSALDLLGTYRTVVQELREAIKDQNETIRTQQGPIRDLKDAAEEQHNLIRDLSQQLKDNQKQTGDELKRVHEQLEAITATTVSTPQSSSTDVTSSSPSPVLSCANTAPTPVA